MATDDQAPSIALVDDPELAAIFERIARAIPGAASTPPGLPPHLLLRVYAEQLEKGARVSLLVNQPLVRDPQLD